MRSAGRLLAGISALVAVASLVAGDRYSSFERLSSLEQARADEQALLREVGTCSITNLLDTGKPSPSDDVQRTTFLEVSLSLTKTNEGQKAAKRQLLLGQVLESTTNIKFLTNIRNKDGEPATYGTAIEVGSNGFGQRISNKDTEATVAVDPRRTTKQISVFVTSTTMATPSYREQGGRSMESYTYCGDIRNEGTPQDPAWQIVQSAIPIPYKAESYGQ